MAPGQEAKWLDGLHRYRISLQNPRMPVVKFPWDAHLVSVRCEACPHARWEKARRAWIMTDADAEAFLQAAHARMYFTRVHCTVTVDDTVWVLGFAQGTPYCRDAGLAAQPVAAIAEAPQPRLRSS